jgi:hypothetical protein
LAQANVVGLTCWSAIPAVQQHRPTNAMGQGIMIWTPPASLRAPDGNIPFFLDILVEIAVDGLNQSP